MRAATAYRFLLGCDVDREGDAFDIMGVSAECFRAMVTGAGHGDADEPRF